MINSLKIKKIIIPNNIFLAPMAGYTDAAFRQICKLKGFGLTTTEMVSAAGIVYDNKKTKELLFTSPQEKPSCVQIFGKDPYIMAEAIKQEALQKFDIIDINMGCPAPKIIRNGEGSALIKNFNLASDIVKACVKSTNKPITVKMRLGWEDSFNSIAFAKMLEESGASLITIHGRTAKQLYSGDANWDMIDKIAQTINIPVIGNGDITTKEIALKRLSSKVRGIMIGRGIISNPFLLSEINGENNIIKNCKNLFLSHLNLLKNFYGEKYAVLNIKKFSSHYFKYANKSKTIRSQFLFSCSYQEMIQIIDNYF